MSASCCQLSVSRGSKLPRSCPSHEPVDWQDWESLPAPGMSSVARRSADKTDRGRWDLPLRSKTLSHGQLRSKYTSGDLNSDLEFVFPRTHWHCSLESLSLGVVFEPHPCKSGPLPLSFSANPRERASLKTWVPKVPHRISLHALNIHPV